MLKQWFLGRKKYSSTKAYPDPLQDPNITCPLGERYVVYRTNPIYIDDNHWPETDTKHSQIAILDPKLHVQTWCSLVCPHHLTTCCTCKPAWTYCDNCHPTVRCRTALPSPDLLPCTSAKRTFGAKRPEVALTPRNLPATMEVAHFYHVIEPDRCRVHGTDYGDHQHHRHLHAMHHHQRQHVPRLKPVADPAAPLLPRRRHDGKKPPLLQIYINSDFVSGIAVTGSNAVISGATVDSDGPHYVNARPDGGPIDGSELLDISAETDSLESLRIDEQIFAPASSQQSSLLDSAGSPSATAVSTGKSSRGEAEDFGGSGDDDAVFPPSGFISPTGSRTLLTDSEVAYEAVRDLYEKLSNNRHRQVVTQAIGGTQKSRALKSYVQNTYETLTKHVRGTYAKLVEEELQKSPSLYLVPTGSTSSAGRSPPPPPASDKRASLSLEADSKESKTTGLKVLTGSLIELVGSAEVTNLTNGNSKMVPDRAYEVTNSDQFITRRDPKYGEQPIPTNSSAAESTVKSTGHRLYDNVRKRFKQKNCRDAFKIIMTTLVGLTAFAIITALSLSINRQ